MLDAATTMCTTFKTEYEVSSEGRKEELDLLHIVRTMAEKRITGMGSSVAKYDDGGVGEYEEMVYDEVSYN